MDVADADLDGGLKEFGRDCPLQSRCSYIDDDLIRDAAIWRGTVEFDAPLVCGHLYVSVRVCEYNLHNAWIAIAANIEGEQ